MSMQALTLETIKQAVIQGDVAFRCRRRMQPAEGPGGKIFPPTYEGGKYAEETRRIDGTDAKCVLIDSVQSQANRIEQALKQEYFKPGEKGADLPVVAVDFASVGLPEVGWITSLDAPHRIADAILRDSLCHGKKFRDSEEGKEFTNATVQNATALFGLCPLALTLGIWDSTGPKGGLGSKFQRALVSEIVAINAAIGVKTSSRIDPLNVAAGAGPVFKAADGSWTLEKGNEKVGKEGKPSEANHGNVTPTISLTGGVTCDYALQTTVLSLAALRRLRFPVKNEKFANIEAQTVLASLGICGTVLAQSDADLRSRCLLVPEGPAVWDRLAADGASSQFSVSAAQAKEILKEAIGVATKAGLPWRTEVLVLQPSKPLVELVKRSRNIQSAQTVEG